MKNKFKPVLGFSLLELVIILAISAALVQLAIPSYKAHIDKANNLKDRAEELGREL